MSGRKAKMKDKLQTPYSANLFEIRRIFGIRKPIISMLHLASLPGQPGFISIEHVLAEAKRDLIPLQQGGVNGLLVENWKEDSNTIETKPQTAIGMFQVIQQLKPFISVPFGINVLNNDYTAAFWIASETQASFVELDVFIDHVRSNFEYSEIGKLHPFEIKVDIADVARKRAKFGLAKTPLLVFIQPKHYLMLDENKTVEQSANEAVEAGADGLLVTKATGVAPEIDRIRNTKKGLKNPVPVGIGSGFTAENAPDFMPVVDFVVVGSALKFNGEVNNPVDLERVKKLMAIVQPFQY